MQLGKFQLVRKLATGGMAEVYLAKAAGPMGFEKTLVLKRILPHLAEDPAFVEMFLGEAKLAAQLEHPNVVQIFDFGEAEGSYFLAMELIDGPNLRKLVKHAQQVPLPPPLCARLVASAAEGLAYAHDFRAPVTGEPLGLIHRDVSPDNILVSRQGAVKVVDFGIAKVAGQSHRTQTGVVKGKVAYMPPEQLQTKPLDRRVDVYALGVVLYELLTGKRPFDATTDVSLMQAILFEPLIPAVQRRADIPAALLQVLDKALAKDRDQRYPDCRALQSDLERYLMSTGESVGAYQVAQFVSQWMTEAGSAGVGVTPPPPSPSPARAPVGTGAKSGTGPRSMVAPVEASVDSTSPTTPMPLAVRSAVQELGPTGESAVERSTVRERAVEPPPGRPTPQERAVPNTARPRTEERGAGLAVVGRGKDGAWKAPPAVVMAQAESVPDAAESTPSTGRVDVEDVAHTRSAELAAPGARKGSGRLVAVAVGGVLLAVGGGFALFGSGSGSGSEKAVPVAVKPLPPEEPKAPATGAAAPGGDSKTVAEARPSEPEAVAGAATGTAGQDAVARETAGTVAPTVAPAEATKLAGGAVAPSAVQPAGGTTVPEAKAEVVPVPPTSVPGTKAVAEKKTTPATPRPRPTPRTASVAKATLEFRIRPYAIVSLNGKVLGQTPLAAIDVPVGKHTLRLVNKELGKDVVKTFEVKADQPNVFKLNLEAE